MTSTGAPKNPLRGLRVQEVHGDARFRNAKSRWNARRGLLLSRGGRFGEASPLPGYSDDSLEDVRRALRTGRDFPPSLRWGLGGLDAGDARVSPPAFASGASPIPLAQVVTSEEEGATAKAQGYAALKVKIGADLERELRLCRRLATAVGLPLRFDANQSLTVAEARRVLPELAECGGEFLEEPVPREALGQLAGHFDRWPLPLALDESLRSADAASLLAFGPEVLVLKGMVLGFDGVRRCLELSQEHGLKVVFSHCLDGPVSLGLSMSFWEAFRGQCGELAQGLGEHSALGIWQGSEVGRGLRLGISAAEHGDRLRRWAAQDFSGEAE